MGMRKDGKPARNHVRRSIVLTNPNPRSDHEVHRFEKQGYRAFLEGKKLTDCPYDSYVMDSWIYGWSQARAESRG